MKTESCETENSGEDELKIMEHPGGKSPKHEGVKYDRTD